MKCDLSTKSPDMYDNYAVPLGPFRVIILLMMDDEVSYALTSMQPGGDPHVLCFVDFDNPTQATVALDALQGDYTYIFGYGVCSGVDYLTKFCEMQFPMFTIVKFCYTYLHSLLVCCEACFQIGNHTCPFNLTLCKSRDTVFKFAR